MVLKRLWIVPRSLGEKTLGHCSAGRIFQKELSMFSVHGHICIATIKCKNRTNPLTLNPFWSC
jgi:hypothetical protein